MGCIEKQFTQRQREQQDLRAPPVSYCSLPGPNKNAWWETSPGVSTIPCPLLTLPINLSQDNVQAAHNSYGISHERTLADRA
jgi:hypothetical protein